MCPFPLPRLIKVACQNIFLGYFSVLGRQERAKVWIHNSGQRPYLYTVLRILSFVDAPGYKKHVISFFVQCLWGRNFLLECDICSNSYASRAQFFSLALSFIPSFFMAFLFFAFRFSSACACRQKSTREPTCCSLCPPWCFQYLKSHKRRGREVREKRRNGELCLHNAPSISVNGLVLACNKVTGLAVFAL